MNNKTKVIIAIVGLAASFAFGRYSVNDPEVKTSIKGKEDVTKSVDKDTKKRSTTTVTESPDGSKSTTTVTEEETSERRDTAKSRETSIDQSSVPVVRRTLNVSALVGVRAFDNLQPIYGASITKEVLGPITVGVWGLSSGTGGVSVGLSF